MEQVPIFTLTIVTLIYLLITVYLGFRGYQETKTAADFLVAGRKTHPIVMALSYGATFISTSAIVGFGGVAAIFGMGILWLPFLNILVGIFIAFVWFGKRMRPMGHNLQAHTFPEFLAKRYQSRAIHLYAALLIFLFMPLYAAAVMIGGARFVEQSFHISYETALSVFAIIVAGYVIAGGLKGVMYTDAFQGLIMIVGMLVLGISTYLHLGGIVSAHQALNDLAPQIPEKLKAGGVVNWAAMPVTGSPMWWQLVTTIVMGVGIGVLGQPQLAVRFMTVKSNRELNRGVGMGALFIFLMTATAYICGALSNVYFSRETGQVAIQVAGGNADKIIPMFINAFMPSWFVVLFMLTLLSAAMSTMSSQFHTMGTAIGRDIYEQGFGSPHGSPRTVLITRLGIVVAIIVTVTLAYQLPSSVIAQATAVFFGLCGATFLPAYLGGLYSKRVTRPAALASMLIGSISALLWLAFVQEKTAGGLGLCKLMFGRDTLGGAPWKSIDAQIIALPLSTLVLIVVSALTPPPPQEHVEECFKGIK